MMMVAYMIQTMMTGQVQIKMKRSNFYKSFINRNICIFYSSIPFSSMCHKLYYVFSSNTPNSSLFYIPNKV